MPADAHGRQSGYATLCGCAPPPEPSFPRRSSALIAATSRRLAEMVQFAMLQTHEARGRRDDQPSCQLATLSPRHAVPRYYAARAKPPLQARTSRRAGDRVMKATATFTMAVEVILLRRSSQSETY